MIAIIIQARMTSTRLPGKVLKEVMGRPLLDYQIERLREVAAAQKIILATTVNREDDPIITYCEQHGIAYYRGSERDVLDRYYQAAKMYNVDHIMRITADCPLVDPRICSHLIDTYKKSSADFVHVGLTFAEGVDCEIFSFSSLERAWREAALQSEREHLTLYLHNHPDLFTRITMTNGTDDSKYRFTVDEPADFLVVKAIIEHLYRSDSPFFTTEDIKAFLDSRQDIYTLNAHVVRNAGLIKSLKEDAATAGASAEDAGKARTHGNK